MHFYIAQLVGFRIYKSLILKKFICFLKRSEGFVSNRNVVYAMHIQIQTTVKTYIFFKNVSSV